jgi:hypothetical protein
MFICNTAKGIGIDSLLDRPKQVIERFLANDRELDCLFDKVILRIESCGL